MQTADELLLRVGYKLREEGKLPPRGCIKAKAKYNIWIKPNGEICKIEEVDPQNAEFCMPATPKSLARSGILPSPHPLHEQLGYMTAALDSRKYDMYIRQLRGWAISKYAHPLVQAVLNYVEKDTLAADFQQMTGLEITKKEKCIARFCVVSKESWGQEANKAWGKYYDNVICADYPKGMCYLTREIGPLAIATGKNLIPGHPNGKYVSSNDTVNFTFRGDLFFKASDAFQVGDATLETLQGSIRYLTMESPNVINMGEETFVLFDPEYPTKEISLEEIVEEKKHLNEIVSGKEEAKETGKIGYMILGGFNKNHGRISIRDYNIFTKSEYYDSISAWNANLQWERWMGGEQKMISPTIKQIVYFAFGRLTTSKHKEKTYPLWTKRLLMAKLNFGKMPGEIVEGIMDKRRNISCYWGEKDKIEWIACAVLHKYYKDWCGKVYAMWIEDKWKEDRSYQYGRALAVLHQIEIGVLDYDKRRETNAARMTAMMVERPRETLANLHQKCTTICWPKYAKKGWFDSLNYYEELLAEIVCNIKEAEKDYGDNGLERLEDTWIFGYQAQQRDIINHKIQKKAERAEKKERSDENE